MNRRDFLRRAGAFALAVPLLKTLPGCDDGGGQKLPTYEYDGPLGPELIFEHGVASGDPLSDRVILWTRASAIRGVDDGPDVDVFWEVATDAAFEDRKAAGWLVASSATDFCTKVDVEGLEAGTTYFYRFMALGRFSPIGRTKTAPEGSLDRMRIAVCSCANMPNGYFLGYRDISVQADLDLVVHLGDYIYEYGDPAAEGRRLAEPPRELVSLGDYRLRYSQYRRDGNLAEAHRQHPWVVVWDDHESANNSARDGADNHQPGTEGTWVDRKAAAVRAWHEWQPVREAADRHIYRSFRFGDLVDLVMLDTRLWGRDLQPESVDDPSAADLDRQLLGADQEAWLVGELNKSDARWTVVGQQVMMGQLIAFGFPVNIDQWDGYQASRQRFYDAVKAAPDLQNLVVLTGDIHSSWAIDLKEDGATYDPATGSGALGVELVVPGITSSGLGAGGASVRDLVSEGIEHIQYSELGRRGYVLLDLDHERAQATWHHYESVDDPEVEATIGAVYAAADGVPHLVSEAAPASAKAGPPLAP